MKKNLLRTVAMAGAAALAVGVGAVTLLAPAQAATLGNATFVPATGNANTIQEIQSDGPCNAPAVRVRAKAYGFGFPANGQIIYGQSVNGFSTTGPMALPVAQTWKGFAQDNGNTYLDGEYDVRIECVNTLGSVVYDDYRTTITWSTPGNDFANIDTATYTTAVNTVATTTTLAASPASPQDEGTAIDLTATVSENAATGTVEFFDGATSLGTEAVSGGVATKTGVNLADGSHDLTAVYSGDAGFSTSTSSILTFVVNNVVVNTTTTLAVNGSGVQYSPVVLDATVVPNNAVGSVEFFDGATSLGVRPLVSGTASYTVASPALGSHSYTAEFVPTDPAEYTGSVSGASAYEVVASSGEIENITTTIPAGALTISVLDDGAVLLPAALSADGSIFEASGAMDPVRVVDTRAGAFGWTANGQLAPFFQGGNASIAAENLGWTPSVTSTSNALMTVNAGAPVAAANAVAITDGSGAGLASERVLANSPAGSSVGTAELGAVLDLKAPTTTAVGTHTAVLTLTAI